MFLFIQLGHDCNKEGKIEKAQSVGKAALICNIVAVILNAVLYVSVIYIYIFLFESAECFEEHYT